MPNLRIDELESVFQIVALSVALMGSGYAGARFVIPRVWRAGRRVYRVIELIERTAYEVASNGGSSLKDQVMAIRGTVELLEARQRAVTHAIDAAIFEADPAGGWRFCNVALEARLGRSLDSMRGAGWKNLIPVESRAVFLTEWSHAVRKGEAFDGETVMTLEGGEVRRVRLFQRPMVGARGERLGWSGQLEVLE